LEKGGLEEEEERHKGSLTPKKSINDRTNTYIGFPLSAFRQVFAFLFRPGLGVACVAFSYFQIEVKCSCTVHKFQKLYTMEGI
jgi:hypothetical protein